MRSAMAGESSVRTVTKDPAATPTTTTTASSQPAVRPLFSDRGPARRTPKMCRFRGSSAAASRQASQRTAVRPVSLFVDSAAKSSAGGLHSAGASVVRSNSLKRIPETTAAVTPASPSDTELSPQLESALGKLTSHFTDPPNVLGLFALHVACYIRKVIK